MNCRWYQEQLANDSVDLWPNGHPSPALVAHTRECALCARHADRELQLRAALADLAGASRSAEPSANVKHHLRVELEKRVPQRSRTPVLLFALAAALICVAIGQFYWRSLRPQAAPAIANGPAVQSGSGPKVPTVIASNPASANASQPKPNVVATARKPVKGQPASPQPADDFYPIVMCDSLTCSGPAVAVRVELPASPLVSRGGSNRTVMADLLVGEDGLVRGVRVLQ